MKRTLKTYDNYLFDTKTFELCFITSNKIKEKKYDKENGYYFTLLNDYGKFKDIRLGSIILEMEDVDEDLVLIYKDGNNKNFSKNNLSHTLKKPKKIEKTPIKTIKTIHKQPIKKQNKTENKIIIDDKEPKYTFYIKYVPNKEKLVKNKLSYQRLVMRNDKLSLLENVYIVNKKDKLDFPEFALKNQRINKIGLEKLGFKQYRPSYVERHFFLDYEKDLGIMKK